MHTKFIGFLAAALVMGAACAEPVSAPIAPTRGPVQATAGEPLASPFAASDATRSRMPAPTDVGVAWDRIAHRDRLRWECRAVPSGWFVMNSLCAALPKVDAHWPGNVPPPGWDGIVHSD